MSNRIFIIRLLFFLAFAIGGISNAQDSGLEDIDGFPKPVSENTYAVIIGVSEYPHMKSLDYAHEDALLFKEFLTSGAGGYVPEEHIEIMLNEEATSSNFWLSGMSWLNSLELKEGDKVYIFMSGHGDAINESEYFFLTYDCQPGKDKNNYILTGNIQLYNLKSRIQRLSAVGVEVILIIDACRTGDLPGGKEGQQFFATSVTEKRAGEIMLLSAGPNQLSYEDKSYGGGHGLFTFYLINGLSGQADEDEDHFVSLMELQEYVRRGVRTTSKDKHNEFQVPVFCCSEDDFTILSRADRVFSEKMEALRAMGDVYDEELLVSTTTKTAGQYEDTSGLYLYNHLKDAIQNGHFKGDGNARRYLDELLEVCRDCPVAVDAKRELASAYLNYGQARINLYLSGKDASSIRGMKKRLSDPDDNSGGGDYFDTQLDKLEKLANTSFEDAARWMNEALELTGYDPFLVELYDGKITFLELFSRSVYAIPAEKDYWTGQINNALDKDSAAYMSNLAGMIYEDIGEFEKGLQAYLTAARKSPEWSYPAINIGNNYNRDQRFKEAEKWYRTAISLDTDYAISYNNLGVNFNHQKKYAEAEQWYREALQRDSSNVLYYNNLGLNQYESQQYSDALKWFHAANILDPKNVDIINDIGRCYHAMKKYKDAEDWYLKVVDIDPYSGFAYNNIGVIQQDQGRYEEAENFYMKAISINPDYLLAYNNLALNFSDQKRYEDAEYWLRDAIDRDSTYYRSYNDLGIILHKKGAYEDAEHYFRITARMDSTAAYPYNNVGSALNSLKKHEEAEEWFRQAIRFDSTYALAYNGLANSLKDRKQYDEALNYYRLAIQLDSTNAPACNGLANTLHNRLQYDEAEYWYLEAIRQDTSYVMAYNNIGVLMQDQGELEEAVKWYREAINQDPDYLLAYINMGLLLTDLFRFEEADEWYLKALERDSTYLSAYNELGNSFHDRALYDEAEYWYSQTILLDSNYAVGYNNVGVVYQDREADDEAERYYRMAILKDPEYRLPYYNLGLIFSNQKKYAEAEKWLLAAIAVDSSYVSAYNELASIFHDQKLYSDAEYWYRFSSRLDSLKPYGPNNVGIELNNQGEYTASEKWFREAIRRDSTYLPAYTGLSRSFEDRGMQEDAASTYLTAIRVNGGSADMINRLATNLHTRGLLNEARQWYLKGLNIDSTDRFLNRNLGLLYTDSGIHDTAEIFYFKAMEFGYSPYLTYEDLSYNEDSRNDFVKRLYYTKKMLEYALPEQLSDVQNNTGWYHFLFGELDSARYYYHLSIGNDSSNTYPLENMSILLLNEGQLDSVLHYEAMVLEAAQDTGFHLSMRMHLVHRLKGNIDISAEWLITAGKRQQEHELDFPEDTGNEFDRWLVEVFRHPNDCKEALDKLMEIIGDDVVSYDFIMDRSPFLIQPLIYDHPGFAESLWTQFRFWYL